MDSQHLHSFHGGLKLPTHKKLSNQCPSLMAPLPDEIILPLKQHVGYQSKPVVRVGEKVYKGQMIASADGYVSLPVHASTSGKVSAIDLHPVPHPFGFEAPCIIIEPDGEDSWCDLKGYDDYDSQDPLRLQNIIRDAGICGLGGAGFPAHVKLREGTQNEVEILIINAVECEPYISCDDRLIREKPQYIIAGTRMIRHAVQAKRCIIAIEEDMPEAADALARFKDDDIELIKVPTLYPQGGEKQLIQTLTGDEVPSGGLPIDIGIVMHNVGTAAAAFRAVSRGEPLISRYITVTGNIPNPRNLQVLLGTPVKHCAELCGYEERQEGRFILGGPMMGTHITDMYMPVTKSTHCILISNELNREPEMPCIRCGNCSEVCPVALMPQQLYWYARCKDHEALHTYHLFDCIECGCCSYVCPSNIPLVQYYRIAKNDINEYEEDLLEAMAARERFLKREDRLAGETAEKQQKRTASDTMTAGKQEIREYIRGAVKRSRKKRQARQRDTSND